MSYPIVRGAESYPKGSAVKCEGCGVTVRVPPNVLVVSCPGCNTRITLTTPNTFQRGPR